MRPLTFCVRVSIEPFGRYRVERRSHARADEFLPAALRTLKTSRAIYRFAPRQKQLAPSECRHGVFRNRSFAEQL